MTKLVSLSNITKHFAGIHALTDVSFDIKAGEVHALVGENGAGKSTLMRTLGGELEPDTGTIEISGKKVKLSGPYDAIKRGVSIIHQEMALAPDLSVAENIFLGQLPPGINWRKLRAKAGALIDQLGFSIPPEAIVSDLTVAHQQVVEIAKALSRNAKVIIFDEPTAMLTTGDAQRLLKIIKGLRTEGVGIAYISHRLDEIFSISDRITVLKNGKKVDTVFPDTIEVDGLIRLMVGRPLSKLFGERTQKKITEEVLNVEGLTLPNGVKNVSFSLRRGEVVGLGGLVGSGRTEVARAIFGADPVTSGRMTVNGKPYNPRSSKHGVRNGIGLVPEDRKGQGVVIDLEIFKNITMVDPAPVTRFGFFRRSREWSVVNKLIETLKIKLASLSDPVSSLSGGNQQKVVLAKWFHNGGDIIILDEPTRGVDVGAKTEIYSLIHRLASEGKAVLVISSEHVELFGLCDRVLVMGEGELRGELMPENYSEENLLTLSITRSASTAMENNQ
ncbi:MAG: sugar ABC transporter ATP-binding protein [Proteobacteria bacterium]|nr:sugar ABC transporter ATP-binding protein [Pseudomonadota bacterium]